MPGTGSGAFVFLRVTAARSQAPIAGLLCCSEDAGEGGVDVGFGGGPGGDADAHGDVALPFGFAAPADAFGLDAAHYGQGLLGRSESDEDLVEFHVVQHGVAGGAEAVGEAAGVAAGAFDERGHAGAALGADGSPEFDTAGAAGHLRRVVAGIAVGAGGQIGRVHCHGAAEGFGVADEGEATVVADVGPFVAVGGPGVGLGEAGGEMAILGRHGGEEAEGAIDVDPGAGFVGGFADFGGWIEGAGVDVAGLDADDGGFVERGEGVGAHAALAVDGDADDSAAAQAEHSEGFQERDVDFSAHDNGDGRGSEEAVVFDVPVLFLEQGVASGGEAGEVGHGGAGDDGAGGIGGEVEEAAEPGEGSFLEDGGGGGHDAEGGVLIPGADHPTGGESGGGGASGDEAEEAAALGGDGGGGAELIEVGEDGFGGGGSFGELCFYGRFEGGDGLRCGGDAAVVDGVEIEIRAASGVLEEVHLCSVVRGVF